MRLNLGGIPEPKDFIPDETWRALREPGPWLMQLVAIVRELTRGMIYPDALKFAKRAAPLLDLTVMEFMRLRKNK
jgi:hypothetical protein